MKIAVIVLNYNRKDLLEKCLKSLGNVEYQDFEVIIVDNGSEDGSAGFVEQQFPSVRLLRVGYNSGYCRGNNIGIKYALKNNFEGLLLLNNDTEVDPLFLQEIIKPLDIGKKIGMVAPKILFIKDKETIDSAGFLITPDGMGKNKYSESKDDGEIRLEEVFCPSGAAQFFTKYLLLDVIENGQFFDEDFVFYYEELDLGWRARLRGWQCMYTSKSIVYHYGSATGGQYSSFFAFFSNRNLFYNIIKNYPSFRYVWKAVMLSLLRYPLLIIGIFFKKGIGNEIKKNGSLFGMVGIFLKSLKDVIKKFPLMIGKRRKIQKRKLVENSEIKRWFRELGLSFFDSIYKL
jgi:GT2 family glycosyltransferase